MSHFLNREYTYRNERVIGAGVSKKITRSPKVVPKSTSLTRFFIRYVMNNCTAILEAVSTRSFSFLVFQNNFKKAAFL